MASRLKTWTAEELGSATLNAEFDNIYTGTVDRTAGRWGANDDIPVVFGTSQDAYLEWDTTQTNDALMLGLSGSRTLIVCEVADMGTNFGLTNRTNPSVLVHSSDATTVADYIEIYHDQTDGVVNVGTGAIKFSRAGSLVGTLSTTGFLIQGTGPYYFGYTDDYYALNQFSLRGAYTIDGGAGAAFYSDSVITAYAANNAYGLWLANTIVEAASGTHALLAGLAITAPVITPGVATVTNTASLYISAAPTATVTGGNYSLFIDAGTIRYDATVQTTVGAAGAGDALPATPTGYFIINLSGTDFVVPYYAQA